MGNKQNKQTSRIAAINDRGLFSPVVFDKEPGGHDKGVRARGRHGDI